MEILIAVVAKAAEYLVPPMAKPIMRRATTISNYETIIQELKTDHQGLQNLQTRVQNDVNEATWNADKIYEDVTKWLQEVNAIVVKDQNWLASLPQANTANLSWGRRLKLGKKALQKKAVIAAHVTVGNKISRVSYSTSPRGIQLLSHDDFTAFPSVTKSFNEVIETLNRGVANMVGVIGMGGIGKTTLVKEVGRVAKEQKIFDQVVMAVISQTPDIRKIQGYLGDMLGLKFSTETEIGRAGQLSNRLKKERTVLIILDDVWSKLDLADIGIPFRGDHRGCKILLTTRREQVCTSMGCQNVIHMKLLDQSEAWSLFQKHAGDALDTPSPEFKEVAGQLIAKCDRLPLALAVMASAVKSKPLEYWRSAVEILKSARLPEIEAVDRNVYACINLSYKFLRAPVTKKCFLMCSLFPEDCEIDTEELVRYAMGCGLFDQDGVDSFKAAKSRVESILRDLNASCLLLRTDYMTNHVKMHDIVRDAALWISSKGDGELAELFLVPASSRYDLGRYDRLARVTAISLLASPMTEQFPEQAECPSLKILLLAPRKALTLSDSFFRGMTSLRVLDLTARRPLQLVLPSSLQFLTNLRTLHLRSWIITHGVAIVGKLTKLEILSLSGCIIEELPEEIGGLAELRFLDLSGCMNLGSSHVEVQRRLLKLEVIYTPNMPISIMDDESE